MSSKVPFDVPLVRDRWRRGLGRNDCFWKTAANGAILLESVEDIESPMVRNANIIIGFLFFSFDDETWQVRPVCGTVNPMGFVHARKVAFFLWLYL